MAMKGIIAVVLCVVFVMPIVANAESVLRVGEDISVESDQRIDGDYYVSAGPFGRTTMSGTVTEDMQVLAGSAVLNGTIGKDLLLVAGTGQMHASVTDDVRIVAGDVTLSEAVGGDVFVIAGTLQVLSTAHIKGDVFFFGGDATIEGTIDGSLQGAAERVRVDGAVGKNIDMHVPGGLTLGDKAAVTGNVVYKGGVPLVRSQASTVEGEVTEQVSAVTTNFKTTARAFLTPLFVTLFAALSLFLLFKRGLQKLVDLVGVSLWQSTGIGAATLIAAPVAAFLLMVTVLGLLLGTALLGGLIMLYALALALTGVVAGALIHQYVRGYALVSMVTIVLGTLFIHVILLIPVIGFLLATALFLVTLGGLTRSVYYVLQLRAE